MMGCYVGNANAPTQQTPYSTERLKYIDEERETTVALVAKEEGSLFSYCAGLWIKKGMILTASHCVDDQGPIIFYSTKKDFENKKTRMAIIASIEEDNDLALLFVEPSSEPEHLNINLEDSTPIDVGQEVDIVGHTVGYTWSYSKGNISAIRNEIPGPNGSKVDKVLQISAPVWMGNSGGGAFDAQGRFLGLCSWISRRGPFLSFFIHKDIIINFMVGKELPVQ